MKGSGDNQTLQKRILGLLVMTAIPLIAHSGWTWHRFRQAQRLRSQAHELSHDRAHCTEAIQLYQKSAELYPYFLETYTEMAELHCELHQWEQAVASLDKALGFTPKDQPLAFAILYRERGMCKLRAGDWSSASQDFQQAVNLDPKDGLAVRLLKCAVTPPHTLPNLAQSKRADKPEPQAGLKTKPSPP